ncbi:MAG: acyl-CoA thioesterase [Burkholderiales bacterium]|nr:acyl-CoA thioesterase [Burkholderiales bacterium]
MAGVLFQRDQTVRFGHCDPAGIVFYPRYFEMLNELVEDWFAQGLSIPFTQLITERGIGMPTAQLDTRFKRVSRQGDVLHQRLRLTRLGGSSLTLAVTFDGDDGTRVEFDQVLVCTSLDTHRPQALPDDMRAAIVRAQETTP